ncbi:hypothetical protein BJ170DRAFT_425358 [Xylariales sp. AK1849]|nr:hypothetical protein BJ170DRAFT_425358 [Xylariales sp. AK1849]
MVFGCSQGQKRELLRRLQRLTPEQNHPLIMSGIFFELERARLEESVDEMLDQFALKPTDDESLDLNMNKAEMTEFLKSCYRSRELQNQINALKRQLRKMIKETIKYDKSLSPKDPKSDSLPRHDHRREQLKNAGRKIKSRLEEICDILDDKINDCNGSIENMSITMQILWNHLALEDNRLNLHFSRVNTDLATVNKQVSEAMQSDSNQMRSIAMVTMIFLPISTVASIFSTSLFSWDAGPGEQIVSRYIWVLIVLSLALTSVVIGVWATAMRYSETRGQRRRDGGPDVEKEGTWFHHPKALL